MPKILYLVTKSEWGGSQKYVFDLSLALKNEFQVLVAAGQGTGELFDKLSEAAVKWVRLKNLKRLPSPLTAFKAIKEIKQLLRTEKPDILHLNSTTAGFLGGLAAKSEPVKVIYTVHGWAFLEPGSFKKIAFFLAEKLTAPFKDRFIVLSEFEKQIGLKITPSEKITVISNGIKELQFLPQAEVKQKLGLTQNIVVGTIANPYKTKGLKYLLKVYPEAVIIGEGPEKEKLKKKFSKARFLGRIENAAEYLRAFDVFCLASVKEGFPWVLLEAMQAGLPIVATKVGAVSEMLANNQQALLVESKNPKALAEALDFLLQNPTKAQELGQQAKIRAQHFTFEKMLSQTKAAYRKLLII